MRADLRLSDLAERRVAPTKLMNVKIPDSVSTGIDQVADELSCSKTAAVVALLNEGLSAFARRGQPSVPQRSAEPKRRRREQRLKGRSGKKRIKRRARAAIV